MLIVDSNKKIITPIDEIVETLQEHIFALGINKLEKIEKKGNNLRITCPCHKGGCESRPSCDVLLEDKAVGKKTVPAGTVHCFSCGYSANFVKFISDCLGISFRKSIEWLLSCADYEIYAEQRESFVFDFFEDKKEESTNYSELPLITCEDLKKFDFYHPYMEKRKLTPEIIEKYEIGYYPEEDVLTFPVYVDGRCLFVAKRKVGYKKFIMPVVIPKPIYGLDYVINENEIYVTESIINALTLESYGLNAVALFGTGSYYQIDVLKDIQARKLVLCLDGDEAGKKGRERIMQGIDNKIVTYLEIPKGKDVNDLSKEEFFSLEEKLF